MAAKNNQENRSTNVWGMIADIAVAAINRGQFLPLCLFALVAFIVWKMPTEDVSNLVFRLFDVADSAILGYFLFVLSCLGWFYHARLQRRIFESEIDRIGREKSILQQENLKIETESSEL